MPKIKPNKIERRVIVEKRTWLVASDTEEDREYNVSRSIDEIGRESWRCNCLWGNTHPDNKPHACDHIDLIKRVGQY